MVYYRMVWGESMKVEAIRVWGDSILKGIVFDSARKRYTIIKDNALSLLSEKVVTPIQNFSRMGATAPEALKALKAKLADASLENQIVVFEVGGNDCDFDWKAVADTPEAEHQPKTPVAVFADVLHEFVSVVSRAGGTPVLCTLPPIDCARYFAFFGAGARRGRTVRGWHSSQRAGAPDHCGNRHARNGEMWVCALHLTEVFAII